MLITRDTVAQQLAAYLEGKRTLAVVVSWAHDAFNEGEFDEADLEVIRDVVTRLGLADVAAFGLTPPPPRYPPSSCSSSKGIPSLLPLTLRRLRHGPLAARPEEARRACPEAARRAVSKDRRGGGEQNSILPENTSRYL
jgi:hypothetical protein